MKRPLRTLAALSVAAVLAPAASAHYNMLFPDAASAKRGQEVAFVYQWGHPFEHQLFETPAPEGVSVIAPDGHKTDLNNSLQRFEQPGEGKRVGAYRFRFTPQARGDFNFVLNTPPIWMEEDQEYLQDTVKVILHVQIQKGWDAATGQPLELVPLTRPYGLEPGTVFQAQALASGKPLPGTLVEVEHYHAMPPRHLPDDEQITRMAKTDPNGVVTCTLTEPGWWCVTVLADGGKRDHDGKAYPVQRRSTLWVFVDEKPGNTSR